MKNLFLLLLIVIATPNLFGRIKNISYSEIRRSSNTITIQLTAWNEMGNQVPIDKDQAVEFALGNYSGRLIDIQCTDSYSRNRPIQSSIVLAIDNSGSMRGDRLDIAKAAAKSLVSSIDSSSEVAILKFNSSPYLMSGFTNYKNQLTGTIDDISSGGETDFQSALTGFDGSIETARNGKYTNKAIIFLTDGENSFNDDIAIKSANDNGIKIYSVAIGSNCPAGLANLSKKTGAFSVGNIYSIDQAKNIYLKFLTQIQNIEPCVLTFEISDDAPDKPITLQIDDAKIYIEDVPPPPPPKVEVESQYNCSSLSWFMFTDTDILKVSDLRRSFRTKSGLNRKSAYLYGEYQETIKKTNQIKVKIVNPGKNKEIYILLNNSKDFTLGQLKEYDVLVFFGKLFDSDYTIDKGLLKNTDVLNVKINCTFICNMDKPSRGFRRRDYKYVAAEKSLSHLSNTGYMYDFDNWNEKERRNFVEKRHFGTLYGHIRGKNEGFSFGLYTRFSEIFNHLNTDTKVERVPPSIFENFIHEDARIIFNGRIVGYTLAGDSDLEDFRVEMENLIYID